MSQPTPSRTAAVAVIVRTKDRPVLLERALHSISAQTFDDIEVVVVDDGGDAGPVDALLDTLPDDVRARFAVVHHDRPRGRSAALNAGLDATSAPLIAVHDDDDSWHPTFLTRCVEVLGSHPRLAGVATRTELVFEHLEGTTVVEERREILAADVNDVTLFRTIQQGFAPPISLLYRRTVHDDVGPYDETLPVLEDWDFMLRLLARSEMSFIDGKPLAYWHQRPDATGEELNSVYESDGGHDPWGAAIRDRYLRRDLAERGGLGYLAYVSELMTRERARRDEQNAHLVHMVQELTDLAADRAADLTADLAAEQVASARHNKIAHELVELNRSAVVGNNRVVAQIDTLSRRLEELEHLIWSQTPRARLKSYQRVATHRVRRALGR